MEKCAALALDVDVTMTHSDENTLNTLIQEATNMGAAVAINTARPPRWCDRGADQTTLQFGIDIDKHHCLNHPNPPISKVLNMRTIEENDHVQDSTCVILMDDRPENIHAVWEHGFSAIYTPTGIDQTHVDTALEKISACCQQQQK